MATKMTTAETMRFVDKIDMKAKVPCDAVSGFWASLCNEVDFHGGITWYSKVAGFDNVPRRAKIGCDYNHYHDQGVSYGIGDIVDAVKQSINSFWILVPNYKCRCQRNGKLYFAKQGKFAENGCFYSFNEDKS